MQDIITYQNNSLTKRVRIAYQNSETTAVTGYTALFTVAEDLFSGSAITFQISGTSIIDNYFYIIIPQETNNIPVKQYQYQIDLWNDFEMITIAQGAYIVNESIIY